MDDSTREQLDAAFENIGEMVRRRLYEREDGLEMCMRLQAGTAALHVSALEGCTFVDLMDTGIVVRGPREE